MKKLLKFAAPILILALIFASCDDRGSTPSGGSSSSLVAEIRLGEARSDYPTSGWQVMFEGRSASNETVYQTASKVEYTAAADENPAFLTVTGIPSDKSVYLTGNAYVMFTSGIAGAQIGSAALSSNPSGISDGEVEEFSSAAPATISLSVKAPNNTLVLPTDPKSYPLALTADDETYTLYPTKVEAPSASKAAKAETPAQMTLTYTASYSPADGVTLPIGILNEEPTTSFNGALKMAIGETPAGLPNYQATGISITGLSAGATVTPSETTLTELYYGSIVVSLPAALNGQDADDSNPAYSYTTVSYVLKSGDTVVAESDAASVTKGEKASQFTIPNIQTGTSGMSLSVSLSVADSKLNRSVVYLGSASSVSGPTEAQGTVTSGSTSISAFYAQLNGIEVTLSDGPTGYWLSSPEAYSVSYIEVAEDGSDLAGAVSVNVPVTSEMASGIATGQKLTISSVDAGAYYKVSVSVKTAYNAYKGATESAVNVAAVTQASPTAVQAIISLVAVEGSGSLPASVEISDADVSVSEITGGVTQWSNVTACSVTAPGLTGEKGSNGISFTGSIPESQLNRPLSLSGTVTTATGIYQISAGTVAFSSAEAGSIAGLATETTPSQYIATIEISSMTLSSSNPSDQQYEAPSAEATITLTAPEGVSVTSGASDTTIELKVTTGGVVSVSDSPKATGSSAALALPWSVSGSWSAAGGKTITAGGALTPTFSSSSGVKLTFSATNGLELTSSGGE